MKNRSCAFLSMKNNISISAVLLIAALVMNLATGAGVPSHAAGIASYRESVLLDDKGGAKVLIGLAAELTGEVLIPCSLPNPCNAFISGGTNEAGVSIENRGGAKFLKLSGAALKNGAGIELGYEAGGVFDTSEAAAKDFGNIEFKYSFVNGTGEKIDSFETSISLPPKMIVNTVSEYLPKLKKDDAGDPFSLSKKDGRRAISLKFPNMKFGDRAALRFNMKKEDRPMAVLIIFILLIIWYLITFRDVIHPHGEHKDHKKKTENKQGNKTTDNQVN